MSVTRQATCKERWPGEKDSTIKTLRQLWQLYQKDSEASDPDLGRFDEYGLSFDYVAPSTFNGQTRGYFRYQLSWGGPSDEFRFYTDENLDPYRVEYWFLDWFDGHGRKMVGKDEALLLEIWAGYFSEFAREKMHEAQDG